MLDVGAVLDFDLLDLLFLLSLIFLVALLVFLVLGAMLDVGAVLDFDLLDLLFFGLLDLLFLLALLASLVLGAMLDVGAALDFDLLVLGVVIGVGAVLTGASASVELQIMSSSNEQSVPFAQLSSNSFAVHNLAPILLQAMVAPL